MAQPFRVACHNLLPSARHVVDAETRHITRHQTSELQLFEGVEQQFCIAACLQPITRVLGRPDRRRGILLGFNAKHGREDLLPIDAHVGRCCR